MACDKVEFAEGLYGVEGENVGGRPGLRSIEPIITVERAEDEVWRKLSPRIQNML